ncbi:MAG: hypothetical protein PVH54_11370, partial [Gammaproteobacteria bacterium]
GLLKVPQAGQQMQMYMMCLKSSSMIRAFIQDGAIKHQKIQWRLMVPMEGFRQLSTPGVLCRC